MKIAVVGAGALGSFYGARLARIEPEVHFLLRSDYQAVRSQGLWIRSFEGDFHLDAPKIASDPSQIGPSDVVLIGLKTTANYQYQTLIAPLLHSQTMIVTLQNGLGNETALARLFGPERIFGGLCFVCLNRLKPGEILHTAHGRIMFGEYNRPAGQALKDLAELFGRAGIQTETTDDLEKAHWEKLIWNVPFNGLGVAGSAGLDAVLRGQLPEGRILGPCLTTDRLLADPAWENCVRSLMREVIMAAQGLGHTVAEELIEENLNRTRVMGAYKASTLLDFERGQPLELESLFLEPLRQGEKAGVHLPWLRALCQLLSEIEQASTAKRSNP